MLNQYRMSMVYLAVFAVVLFANNAAASGAAESALVNHLLASYDPLVKAYDRNDGRLDLSLSLNILRLVSVDKNVLTLNTWLEMYWRDLRLGWEPAMYNDLKSVNLPVGKLWHPDLYLYNNAGSDNLYSKDWRAIVTYDGNVTYIPPGTLRSTCDASADDYKVQCQLKIGSWTYSGNQLDLIVHGNGVTLDSFVDHHDVWTIKNGTVKKNISFYSCCTDTPYVDMTFTIEIVRKYEK